MIRLTIRFLPGRRATALCLSLLALAAAPAALAADGGGSIASRPLAPHPFPRGRTMFTELSPADTGVTVQNLYDDPRMHGDLYEEFETSSVGTGVTIGDYDGDGLADLYVVTKTKGCRLYRNLGGYKFEDVTEKAGVGAVPGVWNQGATFVDINNSGRLDIYVCRYNAPNLLYVNQGDGTFKEMAHAYGLDVVDSSVMAAFSDYDRDGHLDLYIATNILNIQTHPNGQRGILLHNNGDGTFSNVTQSGGIIGESQSHSATWWDYDNDGWPDLYVANDYGYPDRLYHNNRNGTFTDVLGQVLPHTSFSSMGSDIGDVANTGYIDFLAADMAATTHFKDHHLIADARGRDAEADAIAGTAPKYHRNALLLNTGTGSFQEGAFLAGIEATDWTWSVRFEDYDNDGWQDLFVTNGFPRSQGADVTQRMMRAETPAERIRIEQAAPPQEEVHMAFKNMGDLNFRNVTAEWGVGKAGIAFGAAVGDLSGDGNLDIVYANFNHAFTILRNDCDTGHVVNVDLHGTVSNREGIGAVVRLESALGVQVRQLTLSRGYLSSSEPMVHFGTGADSTVRRLTVTWPSGHVQAFENLPVDRRYTVTEPSSAIAIPPDAPAPPRQFSEKSGPSGLSVLSREEDVDEVNVQRLLPIRLNPRGPALAVGDVFGSGRDDVVVGGTTRDSLRILRAGADGTYSAADAAAAATGTTVDDGPVLLIDARGTGRQDLLVTKGGNSMPAGAAEYQPRLLLNDGHGGFSPAPDGSLPPLPISAGALAAADFDHSGRLGVFIGARLLPGSYPQAPQSALLANRGGRFEDVTDALAPGLRSVGMVTSALWTDVDADGWPDLLLALDWGTVRYFHNNQGKGFEDWSERAGFAAGGSGWWTSIAASDLNGDGRIDYVVGNLGLNTHYHATPEHPALLFSGNFRGTGTQTQLIEAYYEGDTLYPWRSKRDLGSAIPSVLRKFPTFDAYARASLQDIVGEASLAKARRVAATELRSGVFLSQPDGTYKFRPLPRIAQISPIQGMAAGDFCGDGHADVYAIQNSFAPVASIGRFDGGISQLLRGDGRGGLAPVAPAESGLVVRGDAKALAVLGVGSSGWPGFLVSRNDGTTLAFSNSGVAGHHPLAVSLRGPAGNPTAVGARVTVVFADGSSETSEIYAGSGYGSQSAARCYFGYPDSNPPRELRIRWPSGAESEQSIGSTGVSLSVAAPR